MTSPPRDSTRAELKQVTMVTLPKIFREIGRRVAQSTKVPASLKHHFDAIAELKPAVAVKDSAAIGRLAGVYEALGRDAYEKYGDKAVPKDIAPQLSEAMARHKTLCDETAQPEIISTSTEPSSRASLGLYRTVGLPLFAIAAAGILIWLYTAARRGSPRESRTTTKTNATTQGNQSQAMLDGVDPSVLVVLSNPSDTYTEHGWGNVFLGESFAQVDEKHGLQEDRLYPWVFRSSKQSMEFVFDEDDVLRACTQVVDGGVDRHGDMILRTFGPTPHDEILHVTSTSKSKTTSKNVYYLCPSADIIAAVKFAETQYVDYGRLQTNEETRVTIVDMPWAISLLSRSATLKRPLLKWMRAAADTVADGEYAVDTLPSVPGTTSAVSGKQDEQLKVAITDDAPDGRRKRTDADRRVGTVSCLAKKYMVAMPGRAGVSVNFVNYTPLAGNAFLKADIPSRMRSLINGEALLWTPCVDALDSEITRVLLQEYFPPDGGKYRFEESGSNSGPGLYRWKSTNPRGCTFEVIYTLNGRCSVNVISFDQP